MQTATLAIIVRENRILLGRKQGNPEIGNGTLNGPGGKMESEDKTIADCVTRETREEFGIELTQISEDALITFHAGGVPDFQVHIYRVHQFFGKAHETQSMVPEWHDITNIPYERMLESDRYWLPLLLHGAKFDANVYYRKRAKGFQKIEIFPL